MDANATPTATFGARHFGRADLGDQRRNRRLVQLADDVTGHPGGTLPDTLRHPKDLKAFYRLMNQRSVTHATVLAPHQQLTQGRMRDHQGVVLTIHDTTTLDYSSLTSLAADLGQIGDGHGRGYLCHNTLAVAADSKEVLGLVNQILFHRPDAPRGETRRKNSVSSVRRVKAACGSRAARRCRRRRRGSCGSRSATAAAMLPSIWTTWRTKASTTSSAPSTTAGSTSRRTACGVA
jgi:hypothetical protein